MQVKKEMKLIAASIGSFIIGFMICLLLICISSM